MRPSAATSPAGDAEPWRSLFAFRRDLSTPEKAREAARRTADLQVSAAKSFGLTHTDLKGGYEYGALGADMTGLGEEKLLAFIGLGKKLNIDGYAQGNAWRAMTGKFLAPTRKGREALAAAGVDYSKRQIMPEKLSVDNFEQMVGQQYGVKLNDDARQKLNSGFSNKDVFTNATAFALMIKDALKGQVGINNAKDANKVLGSAERFRQHNVEKVDVNGLFDDVMKAIQGGNLALANAIFGEKQGNRIMAALRDRDVWNESLKKIENTPDGKAQSVSETMNAGFDGAVARFEGAIKNLETAMGRAWDGGGEGGFLTGLADTGAKAVQALAEMNAGVLQVTGGLTWLGGKVIGGAGTIGLIASAFALTKSAGELSIAAGLLGGRGSAPGLPAAPGSSANPSSAGVAASSLLAGLPTGFILGSGAIGGAILADAMPKAMGSGQDFGKAVNDLATLRERLAAGEAAARGLGYAAPGRAVRMPAGDAGAADGFPSTMDLSRGMIGDFLLARERRTEHLPVPPSMTRRSMTLQDGEPSLADTARQPSASPAEASPLADAPALARARADLIAYRQELETLRTVLSQASDADLGMSGVRPAMEGRKAELEALVSGLQDKLRTLSETSVTPKADISGLSAVDAKLREISTEANATGRALQAMVASNFSERGERVGQEFGNALSSATVSSAEAAKDRVQAAMHMDLSVAGSAAGASFASAFATALQPAVRAVAALQSNIGAAQAGAANIKLPRSDSSSKTTGIVRQAVSDNHTAG